MSKVSDALLKLQRFQWATDLNLKVSYHTIPLDPDSNKIPTIMMFVISIERMATTNNRHSMITRYLFGICNSIPR